MDVAVLYGEVASGVEVVQVGEERGSNCLEALGERDAGDGRGLPAREDVCLEVGSGPGDLLDEVFAEGGEGGGGNGVGLGDRRGRARACGGDVGEGERGRGGCGWRQRGGGGGGLRSGGGRVRENRGYLRQMRRGEHDLKIIPDTRKKGGG